jgi:Lar family restriction alleviation protein
MINKNDKLLPCPFCGSKDLELFPDLAKDDDDRIYAYHVFCNDCHARGRNNYPISWCESKQEAMEAWNDRFIPATIPSEDGDRIQLSTTALLHIHKELFRIVDIKNHIDDLLTPIQMTKKKVKND